MRIKMRELACLLVAALAGTVFAAQPNVVFIMADDLGWKDLGCQGSTYHKTPNIDRLANRSVRFTNYYTASPLCSPTRSSILAGLYPARTGITAPVCHLPALQLEKRLAPGNGNQKVLNADSLTRLKTEYTTLAQVF
ncbi:MAG: sulfatase-like hydrolase/transferase [Gemmataceae bacterium]